MDKDNEHVAATFGGFKTYRDLKPEVKITLSETARMFFKK